ARWCARPFSGPNGSWTDAGSDRASDPPPEGRGVLLLCRRVLRRSFVIPMLLISVLGALLSYPGFREPGSSGGAGRSGAFLPGDDGPRVDETVDFFGGVPRLRENLPGVLPQEGRAPVKERCGLRLLLAGGASVPLHPDGA